jgi:very-short-patch-repair endonuclease
VRYVRDVERAHGLPTGLRQLRRVHGGAVIYDDVAYEPYATVVHLDGRVHEYDARFRDTARDNSAVTEGRDPLRYGWHDVTARPCAVATQVAAVLHRNGRPGVPHACARPRCPLPTVGTLTFGIS